MAYPVRWSEVASDQLDRAAEYIAADSRAYAAAFVRHVRETALTLEQFPHRGRIVPEFEDPAIREIIVQRYRLVYIVEGESATVLAFIHGARDFLKAWQNPEQ